MTDHDKIWPYLTPEQRKRYAKRLESQNNRTPLIEMVWFKMLVSLIVAILAAVLMFWIWGNDAAHAETGTHPHLDHLCANPAFAADTANPVGLRQFNDYCDGSDVILPADYGSGADRPEPVLP